MPFFHRFAGIDISLPGPPVASQINELVSSPLSANLSPYPCKREASTASPPGYRINNLVRAIGHGSAAFKRATSALETGRALELDWANFWRVGSTRWKKGDAVVVGAKVLPCLWTANVNRVVVVERKRNRMTIGWGTTDGHVLNGEEVLDLTQGKDGNVVFTLRSFSRPKALVAWITYPLIFVLQRRFARDVCRELEKAASGEE